MAGEGMTTSRANQEGRGAVKRRGALILARHGRPALNRDVKLTWREYEDWWRQYDLGGLAPDQSPPEALIEAARAADVILTSTLRRARETADWVRGDKPAAADPIFVEAPLPPPRWIGLRRPGYWGVLARISWWMGQSRDGENRQEAELRARRAAARLTALADQGQTVLLCGHGWFNRMIRPPLLDLGWRCVHDGGDDYWSHRRYETDL